MTTNHTGNQRRHSDEPHHLTEYFAEHAITNVKDLRTRTTSERTHWRACGTRTMHANLLNRIWYSRQTHSGPQRQPADPTAAVSERRPDSVLSRCYPLRKPTGPLNSEPSDASREVNDLRRRLRHRFDNVLSRGTWAVLLWLGVATVITLLFSSGPVVVEQLALAGRTRPGNVIVILTNREPSELSQEIRGAATSPRSPPPNTATPPMRPPRCAPRDPRFGRARFGGAAEGSSFLSLLTG